MSATHKLTCAVCGATITVVPSPVEAGGVAVSTMTCPACRRGSVVGGPYDQPDVVKVIGYERQASTKTHR
jgi:hypothetical protein